jgi:hypothetical protein
LGLRGAPQLALTLCKIQQRHCHRVVLTSSTSHETTQRNLARAAVRKALDESSKLMGIDLIKAALAKVTK